MICPKCGSNNVRVELFTETKSDVKGFSCFKAFFGWIFFSLPGILCGLCGMGKGKTTTTSRSIHICQDCGKKF